MQHPAALNVIRSLGPQLEKQAAETVLIDYANEHELAPAQLEKLAQCYNMVRQLSHIDKADDRGSACHQVDTPSLLRTYADAPEKSAAAPTLQFRDATHDANTVDLMAPLRREIAPAVKAASADHAAVVARPEIPSADPEADICYTVAQLKEAAWEAKVDLHLAADAVLKSATCEGRYLQMATAEHDALRQANPRCVTLALDWLEKYAAQQRLSRLLTRHEGPVKVAAFKLTSPLADQVVALAHAFALSAAFHKAATRLGDIPTDEDPTGLFSKMEDEFPTVPPPTDTEPVGGGRPTAALEKEVPGLAKTVKDDREEKSSGGSKEKGAPTKGSETKNHWLASLIGAATKPVTGAGNMAATAGNSARGAVKAVTDRETVNKAQIRADASVADIRRSILIRRLAANDPVLRDMPLRDVLETYNAIAEQNPEVASNPRRVLLAMREATSYEGITLDAQKQLGDVRSVAAKTDDQEANNTKRRYAV